MNLISRLKIAKKKLILRLERNKEAPTLDAAGKFFKYLETIVSDVFLMS